jgi:hypothetical protein
LWTRIFFIYFFTKQSDQINIARSNCFGLFVRTKCNDFAWLEPGQRPSASGPLPLHLNFPFAPKVATYNLTSNLSATQPFWRVPVVPNTSHEDTMVNKVKNEMSPAAATVGAAATARAELLLERSESKNRISALWVLYMYFYL